MTISLDRASLNIWHSSSLLEELLVGCKCGQDICLAERKSDLAVLLIVRHNEILDLAPRSAGDLPNVEIGRSTSSPQRSASRSFPLAFRHMASNCYWSCYSHSLAMDHQT